MIEAILDDEVEIKSASNSPPFAATLDYTEEIAKRDAAVAKWKTMDATARAQHKDRLERFFKHEGVVDPKSEVGLQAKNLHLLRNEILKPEAEKVSGTVWGRGNILWYFLRRRALQVRA